MIATGCHSLSLTLLSNDADDSRIMIIWAMMIFIFNLQDILFTSNILHGKSVLISISSFHRKLSVSYTFLSSHASNNSFYDGKLGRNLQLFFLFIEIRIHSRESSYTCTRMRKRRAMMNRKNIFFLWVNKFSKKIPKKKHHTNLHTAS